MRRVSEVGWNLGVVAFERVGERVDRQLHWRRRRRFWKQLAASVARIRSSHMMPVHANQRNKDVRNARWRPRTPCQPSGGVTCAVLLQCDVPQVIQHLLLCQRHCFGPACGARGKEERDCLVRLVLRALGFHAVFLAV
eukprot:1952471-Rhodomonas_salina.2